MQWSREQDSALKAVADWLKAGEAPVFRLFGYAGTGKTTLARHFAEKYATANGIDARPVSDAAMRQLLAKVWCMKPCKWPNLKVISAAVPFIL